MVALPPQLLCRITVPDRFVATIRGFGHELTVATAWGTIVWNFTINGAPVLNYQNFLQQIGSFINPTLLPVPIKLKWNDVFEVTAFDPTGLSGASAIARVVGHMFPVRETSQDGSYREYHTI